VVTLVDDHLAIGSHPIVHAVLAGDALEHGHVEPPVTFCFRGRSLRSCIRDPENMRVALSLIQEGRRGRAPGYCIGVGHQVDTEHVFPHAGGADEHRRCLWRRAWRSS